MALLLFGCSSAPTIIEREVEVPVLVPAVHDTIMLKDTVIVKDSLWYGEVTDSLGKVIGDLKVYFKRKIAELNLNERRDTIYIKDTVLVNDNSSGLLPVVNSYLSWWEKGILYGGLGLIISLIVYFRVKRGKIL